MHGIVDPMEARRSPCIRITRASYSRYQSLDIRFALKTFSIIIAVMFCPQLLAAPPALPEHVQTYLDAAAPGYELPRGQFEPYLRSFFEEDDQTEPWAIVGDFNGDEVIDWAGMLRDEKEHLDLVVVYSVKKKLSHQILTSLGADEDGIYFGVVLEPVGEIHGFPLDDDQPDPVVKLKNPGIHLFYFEKSSVLYYWDQGTFRDFWTSD